MATTKGASSLSALRAPTKRVPAEVLLLVVTSSYSYSSLSSPAISICVFTNWLANLVVGLVFPQLQIYLENFSFLPFLIITLVLSGILFFYFAETKGKTANEVADLYQIPDAWKTFIGNPKRSKNLNVSQRLCVEMASK